MKMLQVAEACIRELSELNEIHRSAVIALLVKLQKRSDEINDCSVSIENYFIES